MKPRKKLLFKINGVVVIEEDANLYLNQIDEFKQIIIQECECNYNDIDVEIVDADSEVSDIDVSVDGMLYWKDTQGTILTGVESLVEIGSDEYLDAIAIGNIEEMLHIN